MRVCPCGNQETPEKLFYAKSAVCRECYISKKSGPTKELRSSPSWKASYNQRIRERRRMPEYRATFILTDSRKSDRKHGRPNDLTLTFVQEMVQKACHYCGDLELKRTLDRKNNLDGHTQENVLPCCLRCNYLRRDMPFAAWVRLAPELRRLQEEGLFGDWVGGVYGR